MSPPSRLDSPVPVPARVMGGNGEVLSGSSLGNGSTQMYSHLHFHPIPDLEDQESDF